MQRRPFSSASPRPQYPDRGAVWCRIQYSAPRDFSQRGPALAKAEWLKPVLRASFQRPCVGFSG
eukprot:2685968-Lingulodinium_polyedra.AAC.1